MLRGRPQRADLEVRADLVAERVGAFPQHAGVHGRCLGETDRERRRRAVLGERQLDVADRGARAGQRLRRLAHRSFHVGVERRGEVPARDAERQPGNAAVEAADVVVEGHVDAGRIARIVAGEHGEREREVADRAAERSGGVQRRRERHDAVPADSPVRGLQARDAAAGRRDPDRAARVGAERDRALARGDGRGRAAARAAGHVPERPRVVRSGGRDAVGELVRVRLAEEHGAGLAQAHHTGRVARRHAARVGAATALRGHPGGVEQILGGDRDAVQRAPIEARRELALGVPGGLERLLGQHAGEGGHRRLDAVDPLERGLGELDRGHLAAADQLPGAGRVELEDCVAHHRAS